MDGGKLGGQGTEHVDTLSTLIAIPMLGNV